MPLEATAIADRSGTTSAPLIRRKRIDGRTKTARRIAELLADYASRLHLPSTKVKPTIHATGLRLAELETLAESQRAAALRGESVDLDGLVRLENASRRLKVDLGLEGPPPPPPLPATLDEMLNE
jgi:hypothetical protein